VRFHRFALSACFLVLACFLVGVLASMSCGSSSASDNSSPSTPRDDTICTKSCAIQEMVPCLGAPTQDECVAQCKMNRDQFPNCITEINAYIDCFDGSTIMCFDRIRGVANGTCQTELSALQACKVRSVDAG